MEKCKWSALGDWGGAAQRCGAGQSGRATPSDIYPNRATRPAVEAPRVTRRRGYCMSDSPCVPAARSPRQLLAPTRRSALPLAMVLRDPSYCEGKVPAASA